MIWLAIFGPSHYRKKQHARLASKQEPPPVPGWLILYWRLDHVDDRRSHSKHHNDRLPFFIIPGLVLLASPTLLYYSVTLLPSYFVNRLLWAASSCISHRNRWPCQRSVAASLRFQA
jgi:hypothetical protein